MNNLTKKEADLNLVKNKIKVLKEKIDEVKDMYMIFDEKFRELIFINENYEFIKVTENYSQLKYIETQNFVNHRYVEHSQVKANVLTHGEIFNLKIQKQIDDMTEEVKYLESKYFEDFTNLIKDKEKDKNDGIPQLH
jgi:predicted nuclease with TOPRIM domain